MSKLKHDPAESLEDTKKRKLEEEQQVKIITGKGRLRKKSKKVDKDYNVKEVVDRIKKAIPNAWTKGYGLAAIQIGIPVRIAYYEYNKKRIILVNPEVISQSDERVLNGEGCLSIPNKKFNTKRFNQISITTMLEGGVEQIITAQGTEAFIIQHEIDHMNGVLCCDREFKDGPVSEKEVKEVIKLHDLEDVDIAAEAKLIMEKTGKLSANQRAIVLILHANAIKQSIKVREKS